jgi:hypothetical protein
LNASVQPATSLKQKPSIPVSGKGERKPDSIRLAVGAGAAIDDAIETAERRQLDGVSRCAGAASGWRR